MPDVRAGTNVEVVGVPIARLDSAGVLDQVLTWRDPRHPKVAVGVNAAVCNLAARSGSFLETVRSVDLAYADGQSVVWASRILGAPIPERTATTDLVYPLALRCAELGRRVYLFGGRPGVARTAGERLEQHAPGLVQRSHDGDIAGTERVLAEIAEFRPDVLLVGLGDPLQQDWVSANLDRLAVPAILTCGGLFDWVSGAHRRAPEWMISAGLEWLWRLMLEPRRLAARYLLGNPQFVARLGIQLLRTRTRPVS